MPGRRGSTRVYRCPVAASYLLPDHPCRTVAEYRAAGLGDAVDRALTLGATGMLDLLEASGLRSRDHAAVAVASKWSALVRGGSDAGPRYLVANATDGEPGSFTDRALIRANPLGVVEGIVVSALTVGAKDAFVAIRESFAREYDVLVTALAEAEMAGWLEQVSVKCVRTPDAYLVGDERALLECIEGRPPRPRRLSPAVDGLFAVPDRAERATEYLPEVPNPTTVETIETLVNVAAIAVNGGGWFRSMGTAVSPGNLLCTITGDVLRHGVVEAELGLRLVDVIEQGGNGFRPDAAPKAVLSGVSSPVLTRSRLAAPMSWEGLGAVGASLGRAAFLVYGEHTDMVDIAHRVAAFLYVESCGWCPACKFGGGEVTAYLARLVAGTGEPRDLEALNHRLPRITEGRRCDLPVRHHEVVASILRAFPGDFARRSSRPDDTTDLEPVPLEHVVDIVEGRAVLGTAQAHKRADGVVEDRPVHLTVW